MRKRPERWESIALAFLLVMFGLATALMYASPAILVYLIIREVFR